MFYIAFTFIKEIKIKLKFKRVKSKYSTFKTQIIEKIVNIKNLLY